MRAPELYASNFIALNFLTNYFYEMNLTIEFKKKKKRSFTGIIVVCHVYGISMFSEKSY